MESYSKLDPLQIMCSFAQYHVTNNGTKGYYPMSNDAMNGTAVVRTYIDQLAQVLSALVGWSKIEKCGGTKQAEHGTSECKNGNNGTCQYLDDVERNGSCETCGCIKGGTSSHLGRGCTRCSDSGGNHKCDCKGSTGGDCKGKYACECAKKGKCCKCCCTSCDKCKKECSCIIEDGVVGRDECNRNSYMSAYPSSAINIRKSFLKSDKIEKPPSWNNLEYIPPDKNTTNGGTITHRRHHCARILLGSVCLIWSGLTYMYWTGRQPNAKNSPYWNNHILDGSGLDDGTLSQWLQALGFPKEMLNNSGPKNRLDMVINNDFVQKFFLGFADTTDKNNGHGKDQEDNTFRSPAGLNFAGFLHKIDKGAFIEGVFKDTGNGNKIDPNKLGPLFKLYILSCAYFTALQHKATNSLTKSTTPRNPKTIREVLYWLSALPYSPAYQGLLGHCHSVLKEVAPAGSDGVNKFTFKQDTFTLTVQKVDLYAHFQAVTQYCPLVLIGIQGGLKGTDSTKEPPIHALYSNSHFSFTYPEVKIQAYNQVVHYIRALFYQLYFLRKQCAVKVTCGGKWRECRYGDGVLGRDVVSWMCLGCDPMEHDRKKRVDKLKKTLGGVIKGTPGDLPGALKDVLEKIGDVVVQLGNAQEALEGKAEKTVIEGVIRTLKEAREALEGAVKNDGDDIGTRLYRALEENVAEWEGHEELDKAKKALEKLTGNGGGGSGKLKEVENKLEKDKDQGKNAVTSAIRKVLDLLSSLAKGFEEANEIDDVDGQLNGQKEKLLSAIKDLLSICNSPKCPPCESHSKKCGRQPQSKICKTCHQQYMDGTPSPLQAFLEDRLPGFSCRSTMDELDKQELEMAQQKNADASPGSELKYPSASSHAHHISSPGQCCPLPMGFRGHFMSTIGVLNSTSSTLGSGSNTGGSNERKYRDKGTGSYIGGQAVDLAFNIFESVLDAAKIVAETNLPHTTGQRKDTPTTQRVVPSLPPTGARLYGILYFFCNDNMMQSCVYRLVRVTAALSATTPQVLGDVFGFFRGGVGNKEEGEKGNCEHQGDPSKEKNYFCGWCASGLRDEVKKIGWISKTGEGKDNGYQGSVGTALVSIKGQTDSHNATSSALKSGSAATPSALSALTKNSEYLSPLTGELYTAVSATFGHVYLQWVLYLSDALEGGLKSLASEFQEIECRGCKGNCDPNKCKKGQHGQRSNPQGSTQGTPLCQCQSIVSCTGVLPVLYRHGFSYGNPFNLEGYQQGDGKDKGDYSIENKQNPRQCHEFLESLNKVLEDKQDASKEHPLSNLLTQVGKLQYDIRLPWIFVLTLAWLVAVLYLAFGAIWPLDWIHMRSHWLRGGEHQWRCMWYKVMTGRKGMELVEYFGRK